VDIANKYRSNIPLNFTTIFKNILYNFLKPDLNAKDIESRPTYLVTGGFIIFIQTYEVSNSTAEIKTVEC